MKETSLSYMDKYELWKMDSFFDDNTRKEVAELTDIKEIEDRFYRDLKFGTGGLRGIMGAGTNRINKYTIGKATMGLGQYLLDNYGLYRCKESGVVIGYDTRVNSQYFAQMAANVLSSMGIRVFIMSSASPTPQLSFTIKYFNALAGVVITASHNTKEYNGYKVYDKEGGQIVPHQVKRLVLYIDAISDFRCINFEGDEKLIQYIDTTSHFVSAVLKQSRLNDVLAKEKLNIIYTPLHGTGKKAVTEVLEQSGFKNMTVVKEQDDSDGEFPTVKSPNPEDKEALKLGIEYAANKKADIVLGTDPDCDRVGIAIYNNREYCLLTGNQVGALLVDYVLNNTDLNNFKSPAVIKTIVSSELGADIARKRGIKIFSTLTGFKYVGEKITQFEKAKIEGDRKRDYDFLIGYEESYGYLIGTQSRDKDAVVSSLLICEMAAAYKKNNKTLLDRLNELYDEYGYYLDASDSFTLKGKKGSEKIQSIMKELRESQSPFKETVERIDYNSGVKAEDGFGNLPAANVLKYILKNGSWIAIRPSGTEPKIKIYYSIKEDNKEKAEDSLNKIRNIIIDKIQLN